MSQLSNFSELGLLDHFLNKETFTSPTTWVALFTVTPTDAGAGTEVTGGSYARVNVFEKTSGSTPRWVAAVASGIGSVVDNAQEISFAQATANWGVVKAFGIFDASTVGNLLMWGPLGSSPQPFCGLNAGDIFHSPGHGFVDDDKVVLLQTNDNVLPTGVVAETEYFIITASTDNFQLSLTQAGGAIVLTTDGQGTAFATQWRDVQTNDTFKFGIGDLNLFLQ